MTPERKIKNARISIGLGEDGNGRNMVYHAEGDGLGLVWTVVLGRSFHWVEYQ